MKKVSPDAQKTTPKQVDAINAKKEIKRAMALSPRLATHERWLYRGRVGSDQGFGWVSCCHGRDSDT
jgi:hypothetical protein